MIFSNRKVAAKPMAFFLVLVVYHKRARLSYWICCTKRV